MKFEVVVRAKWGEVDVIVMTALDYLVEADPDASIHVEAPAAGVSTHAKKRELRAFTIDMLPVR